MNGLKGKIGPLPKWGWALILGVGIGGAWYLYHKSKASSEESGTEAAPEGEQPASPSQVPEGTTGTLGEQYGGTEAGGGLQGLGVAGPQSVSTTPVASPYIPEGETTELTGQGETIEHQSETISGLATGILEHTNPPTATTASPPTVNIRNVMGSSHKRKPNHRTPSQPQREGKHWIPAHGRGKNKVPGHWS